MDEERLSSEDERRLLGMFEQSSLNDYPNPERIGCPGSAFLKKLATDRTSIPLPDPNLSHVTHCSPCFREFREFREQARRRKRFNRVATLAAMTLVVAGLSLYFGTGGHSPFETHGGDHVPVVAANLNLKDFVLLRGLAESEAAGPEQTRVLHRGNLALTITLPLASEPGTYEFEVVRDPDKPLAFAKGEARTQNGLAVATVKLDISGLPSGAYFWGIRRESQAWAYCPIRIIP